MFHTNYKLQGKSGVHACDDSKGVGAAALSNSVRTFTPVDLAAIYNFPPASASRRARIAIISFGGGLFGTLGSDGILANSDCDVYWRSLGLQDPLPTVYIQDVSKGKPSSNNDTTDLDSTIENTLDVQIAGAVCPNADIHLLVAKNTDNGMLRAFQMALDMQADVVSSSWGFAEDPSARAYLHEVDAVLQRCAETGVTVCCASGDNGATDATMRLNVDFPASSPHVVGCGGTRLVSPANVYDEKTLETVWNNDPRRSAAGGGVSRIFARPAWQTGVDRVRRCVPDLALDADPQTGIEILVQGERQVTGGTSCCAPLFAGYLARIGCRQFAAPLLYQAPADCFHDTTQGDNGGFSAQPGYDLASGRGSIDGTRLAAILAPAAPSVPPTVPPTVPTPSPTLPAPLTLFPVLHVGESRGLFAVQGADEKAVLVWTSDHPDIASVDAASGQITAQRPGFATIHVQLPSSNGAAAVSTTATLVVIESKASPAARLK